MNQLIQRFVNKDPDKTLIGFGDWSARDAGIKGHPKGPVLKFKRALTRVCTVVDIDEFRTSQLHSECHSRMKNMISEKWTQWKRDPAPVLRKVKIHSVLHCTNSDCRGIRTNNRHDGESRQKCRAKHSPVAPWTVSWWRPAHLLPARASCDRTCSPWMWILLIK